MLQTLVLLRVNIRLPLHQEKFFPVLLDVVAAKENSEAEQGSDGHG
jgi:hypothetical protein